MSDQLQIHTQASRHTSRYISCVRPHTQVSLHCYVNLGPTRLWEKTSRHDFFRTRWMVSDGSSSSLFICVYVCVCVSAIVSVQTAMRIDFIMSQGSRRHRQDMSHRFQTRCYSHHFPGEEKKKQSPFCFSQI